MKLEDFKLTEYQVAIFQENFDFSVIDLYEKLLKEFTEFEIIPELIPDNLPKNIVRITMKKKESISEIKISPLKISYYWNFSKDDANPKISSEDILSLVQNTYSKIVPDTKVKRVGFIALHVSNVENKFKIFQKMYREHLINDIRDFSSKLIYEDTIDNLPHNKLYTIESNAILNETNEEVLTVQSDFNSHQDYDLEMNLGQILKHLEKLIELNNIESIYKEIFR